MKNVMQMRLCFLYFLMLVGTTRPAFATGIFSYSAGTAADTAIGLPCQNNTSGAGVTATCSISPTAISSYSGFASAQADPGSLHGEAISIYSGVPPIPGYNTYGGTSNSDSEIEDTLFLRGAPASGFLRFSLGLAGSVTLTQDFVNANSEVNAVLAVGVGSPLQATAVSLDGNLGSISKVGTVDVAYSGNAPVFFIDLVTRATCVGPLEGPQPGNCSADALFSDTGTVDGIEILNSDHQPVSGATFTSASGYVYPSLASSPEPNTFGLVAGVCVAFGFAARRLRLKRPA